MANKKVVGELVYEIRGDDTQYNKVINNADTKARGLGKTVSGVSADMVKSLAGAYLGWQGLKAGIDATVGSAIRYEDAFAGVRKTVDGSEEQLSALSKRFRELSKEIPISAEEFARIGELAGQLGVPIEQIDNFAETIAKIGVTTNLSVEQASTQFARFANIMQTPLENISNIGSAVVDLGNNFATTESEILEFGLRIAGAGAIAGLTEAQVLAIGTALSSVGVEAEAGGTAVQKVLLELNKAVNSGGKELEQFAIVAGMSGDEFAKAYKDDAGKAFDLFVKGLGRAGGDATLVLDELGLSDVRLQRAFLSLAGAGDLLTRAMETGSVAVEENNALQIEADKRFQTTASQIQLLKNNWADLGRQLGFVFLPVLNIVIKFFKNMADTIIVVVDAIKTAMAGMGVGVLMIVKSIVQRFEFLANSAIKVANKIASAFGGTGNAIKEISLGVDKIDGAIESMKNTTIAQAQKTAQSFLLVGSSASSAGDSTKDLADTQTLLKKSMADSDSSMSDMISGLNDSKKASEEAEEEAKKLADSWTKLKDETIDLEDKGTKAIQELAENNVKDLEKIEDKITDLKTKLLELQQSLTEDLASEDLGIAEKIVEEERKLAELKEKLKDNMSKGTVTESDIEERTALQAEIKAREDALIKNAELQNSLSAQIEEARRRASLTDIERSIEDYIAKKAQIQLEYDEKKLALENELLLEEENKAKAIALLEDKQAQINTIIELGNQRFQDLADNRVKITEEEVKKQIAWYNKLAEAIAKSKSATRTSELPQFHKGGYVSSGGEVHAGEYVIPANMVNKYSGLIKALEGARIGSAGSTTNNNINMNNIVNEQIDMDAVLKNMSFELNK